MYFLSSNELAALGLRDCGRNVMIDRTVRIMRPEFVSIGDNVRIDCFGLISAGAGGVTIENHVHISSGVYLYGGGGMILLRSFSGLSPGVKVFTASDDFSGNYLRGPLVSAKYRNITQGDVIINENAQVGAGCVVLPNVQIGRNSGVGALSLVTRSVPANQLVAGVPAQKVSECDGVSADQFMSQFLAEWTDSDNSK